MVLVPESLQQPMNVDYPSPGVLIRRKMEVRKSGYSKHGRGWNH
jgi:hypothetical protein